MAHIDRDYTEQTLLELSEEMDDYFGKDGKVGWIREKLYKFEFFSIRGESAVSYDRYIKSLGITHKEVERKIEKCLKKIIDVEEDFGKTFLNYKRKTDSYIKMTKNLSDCISLKNFHVTYDFSKLHRLCREDKLNVIDLKVYDILEKDCTEWTDEDLEILAYVYCNTNDDELKEQIVNSFYTETTDKRFKSDNPHKTSIDYKYYDRNKEQWNKFVKLEQYYYASEYKKYLDGDDSVDIEKLTRNNLEISHLNKSEYSVLISQEDFPIDYDENGNIELCVPKYKEIHIGNQRNVTIVDGRPGPNLDYSYETVKNDDESFCVYNVEKDDGQNYIKNKLKDESCITQQTSLPEYIGEKLVDKTVGAIGAGADTVLPGSGKIIDAIYDYAIEDAKSKEGQTNDPKVYELEDMEDYVNRFDLMVIHSSDGMRVMHTPESRKRFGAWMQLIEKKYNENSELYGGAYELFVKGKTIDSYINGEVDIYEFVNYADNISDYEINAFYKSLA